MIGIAFILLSLLPQAGLVIWDSQVRDFGALSREVSELECDFRFTNNSQDPVSISYATATCSCTSLSWTIQDVQPGECGSVHVVYTRESVADSFDKGISVFFKGDSKPCLLRISGSFFDTELSLARDFPCRRSSLGFSDGREDVGKVHPGELVFRNLFLANFSDREITVSFDDIADGLELSRTSCVIAPKSRFEMSATILPDSLRWGRRNYYFTPVVDGERCEPVAFSAVVLPDYSALSPEERNAGAVFRVLGDVHHFGVVHKGAPAKIRLTLANLSSKSLAILDASADRQGISVSAPASVPPSGRVPIQVTFSPESLTDGANECMVSILTDSPLMPYEEIKVIGFVENQ